MRDSHIVPTRLGYEERNTTKVKMRSKSKRSDSTTLNERKSGLQIIFFGFGIPIVIKLSKQERNCVHTFLINCFT